MLAAFALTEPDHGSDSVSLETEARRDGDEWVLERREEVDRQRRRPAASPFVWARVVDPTDAAHDGKVRGFLVPQETAGLRRPADPRQGVAARASIRPTSRSTDVRVPLDAVLPGTHSFKDASTVLYSTRSGVAWSALGHATACYEAALSYSQQRMQFGKPLAKFQMVQERLAQMLDELTAMQLYCRHMADLETAGDLRPTQASLAKYHNTRAARRIASVARDLLGGNGILLENRVMQHMADIEAIHTYEGTESVQALLIGRDITGHQRVRLTARRPAHTRAASRHGNPARGAASGLASTHGTVPPNAPQTVRLSRRIVELKASRAAAGACGPTASGGSAPARCRSSRLAVPRRLHLHRAPVADRSSRSRSSSRSSSRARSTR